MLEKLLDGKNWFPVVLPVILATGHVFAITTKMMLGTLPHRIDPWFALPFGLAMAIPGYGLAWLASRSLWCGAMGASTTTSETMEA